MTITTNIMIDKPLKYVWDFADDEKNCEKWLSGFQRWELISGEKGKVGQVADQYYTEKGREFTLRETLLAHTPMSHVQIGLYHKTMSSVIDMNFKPFSEHQTALECKCDIDLKGIWRIMGPLMKKSFQKRQDGDFERLKSVCEAG